MSIDIGDKWQQYAASPTHFEEQKNSSDIVPLQKPSEQNDLKFREQQQQQYQQQQQQYQQPQQQQSQYQQQYSKQFQQSFGETAQIAPEDDKFSFHNNKNINNFRDSSDNPVQQAPSRESGGISKDTFQSASFRQNNSLNSENIRFSGQQQQQQQQQQLSQQQQQQVIPNGVNNPNPVQKPIKSSNKSQLSAMNLQFSMPPKPYLQLSDRVITAKQFLSQFKEGCKEISYDEAISGACRFAINMYLIEKTKPYPQLQTQYINAIHDANQIFDLKFALTAQQISVRRTETADLFKKYMHATQQKLLYQKVGNFGRIIEREAFIVEGKIKQLIEDKKNPNRESIDSITQNYKEKQILSVDPHIEQKGNKMNNKSFKWTSRMSKRFRLIFKDINQQSFAVYTDSLDDAVRLRDYAICFTLERDDIAISPIGIIKFLSSFLPKARIACDFRQKLKAYSQYVKIQDKIQLEEAQRQFELRQQQIIQEQKEQEDSLSSSPSSVHIQDRQRDSYIQGGPMPQVLSIKNENNGNINDNRIVQKNLDLIKLEEIPISQDYPKGGTQQIQNNQYNSINDPNVGNQKQNSIRSMTQEQLQQQIGIGLQGSQQQQQQQQLIGQQQTLLQQLTGQVQQQKIQQNDNISQNKQQLSYLQQSSQGMLKQTSLSQLNQSQQSINQSQQLQQQQQQLQQQQSQQSLSQQQQNQSTFQMPSKSLPPKYQQFEQQNLLQQNQSNQSLQYQSSKLMQQSIQQTFSQNQQQQQQNTNTNNNRGTSPVSNYNSVNRQFNPFLDNNSSGKDRLLSPSVSFPSVPDFLNAGQSPERNNNNNNNNPYNSNINDDDIDGNDDDRLHNLAINSTTLTTQQRGSQQQQQSLIKQSQIQNNNKLTISGTTNKVETTQITSNIENIPLRTSNTFNINSSIAASKPSTLPPYQTKLLQCSMIREYDQIFIRRFGEQLRAQINNLTEQKTKYEQNSVKAMREEADAPVDVYLTFHQLQLEFKADQCESEMVLKPMVRLEISESKNNRDINGISKPSTVEMCLRSRISNRTNNIKEYELYGESKMASILGAKLVRLRDCEVCIEVIDDLTSSLIAKNTLQMHTILPKQSGFLNLLLTIQPKQSLADKVMISVHLQSFIQPSSAFGAAMDGSISPKTANNNNQNTSNVSLPAASIPTSIETYLQAALQSQNYIMDSFYQTRLVLQKFPPSNFKLILHLIASKGISTAALQLSFRKQDNKLESYQAYRVTVFKYYMEKQAAHQCQLAKNIPEWNKLYDDIITASEQIIYNYQSIKRKKIEKYFEYDLEGGQPSGQELDTSNGFILRDAAEEMIQNDQPGADGYYAGLQSVRGYDSKYNSGATRRIVSQVFYKRDIWETIDPWKQYYKRMVMLSLKGIPNALRTTIWLEVGKASKYAHILEQQQQISMKNESNDNQQNNNLENNNNNNNSDCYGQERRSRVYRWLLASGYDQSRTLGGILQEIFCDLQWYRDIRNISLDEDQLIQLTHLLTALGMHLHLNESKAIYAKYLIPFAVKALEFFKSEATGPTDLIHVQENGFWLIITFMNKFARRYYTINEWKRTSGEIIGSSGLQPLNVLMMIKFQQQLQQQIDGKNNKNNDISDQDNSNNLDPSNISKLPSSPSILLDSLQPSLQFEQQEEMKSRIKQDIILFEYWLRKKQPKLADRLRDLSFPIGLFYVENSLNAFSELFNHELLFRIWDWIFIESASTNIDKYWTIEELKLAISVSATLLMDCNVFMEQSYQLYQEISQEYSTLVAHTEKQQQRVENQQKNKSSNNTTGIIQSIVNASKDILFSAPSIYKHLESVVQAYQQLNILKNYQQQLMVKTVLNDSFDIFALEQSIDALVQLPDYLTAQKVKQAQTINLQQIKNQQNQAIIAQSTNNNTNNSINKNGIYQQSQQSAQMISQRSGTNLQQQQPNQSRSSQYINQPQDSNRQSLIIINNSTNHSDQQPNRRNSNISQSTHQQQSPLLPQLQVLDPQQQSQVSQPLYPVMFGSICDILPTEVSLVCIRIHGLEMVEDYNELLISMELFNQQYQFTTKKLSSAIISQTFVCPEHYVLRDSHTKNSNQSIKGKDQQLKIQVFENINNISLPLKQAYIDLQNYELDVLTKDYQLLYDFKTSEQRNNKDIINSYDVDQQDNDYYDRSYNSQQQYNQLAVQKSSTTNFSSGIEYSIIIVTQHTIQQYNRYNQDKSTWNSNDNSFKQTNNNHNNNSSRNSFVVNSNMNISSMSNIITNRGMSQNQQRGINNNNNASTVSVINNQSRQSLQQNSQQYANKTILGDSILDQSKSPSIKAPFVAVSQISKNINSSSFLKDTFLSIPELFQILKNQQENSKLSAFNKLKKDLHLESISNNSLHSCELSWKLRTALNQEQFRLFTESVNLPFWKRLPIQSNKNNNGIYNLLNMFAIHGRISMSDLMTTVLSRIHGRYPEKVKILQRILQISSSSSNPQDTLQVVPSQEKSLLGLISELYAKNGLYLPLNQHFQSFALSHLPRVTKAKYFFDNYSLPNRSNQQLQKSYIKDDQQRVQQSGSGYSSSARLSLSIDLTIFIQSFCAQQMQFKGCLDFMLDSSEFIESFRTYFKVQHNIDNPTGKLQIFYWSKGQLRQLRASYGYQTLGVANLCMVKLEKEVLGGINEYPSVLNLMEFNDTVIRFQVDQNIKNNQLVADTLSQLPLMGYFNSISNAIISMENKQKQITNSQQTQWIQQPSSELKQIVYLKFNIDGVTVAYFKLIQTDYCLQPREEQQQQQQNHSQRQNFSRVLEDWKIIRNLALPFHLDDDEIQQRQQEAIEQGTIIPVKVDSIPLWLRIEELSRFISLYVMQSCIEKIESFTYQQRDEFWMSFFKQIRELDMQENLKQVAYFDETGNELQLDFKMNLQGNFDRIAEGNQLNNPQINRQQQAIQVSQLPKICLIFDYQTKQLRTPLIPNYLQSQQYSIFHFKDGGKQWLPCTILGYHLEQAASTPRFYVEFVDFQGYVFLKTESEISIDQDIQLENLDFDEIQGKSHKGDDSPARLRGNNHNNNYKFIDEDEDQSMNIQTQYWERSQYNPSMSSYVPQNYSEQFQQQQQQQQQQPGAYMDASASSFYVPSNKEFKQRQFSEERIIDVSRLQQTQFSDSSNVFNNNNNNNISNVNQSKQRSRTPLQ